MKFSFITPLTPQLIYPICHLTLSVRRFKCLQSVHLSPFPCCHSNLHLHDFTTELKLQAPVCPPCSLDPTKCILSNLVKMIFQKCIHLHAASFVKSSSLISFRTKSSKATYLRPPASFSILTVAPHSLTPCSNMLNSFWLLEFTESRSLHMPLHPFEVIVLTPSYLI